MKTKIRELRKARKLSQEELADAVGTTRQTITSIEVEKYTASLPLAYKIAHSLSISLTVISAFLSFRASNSTFSVKTLSYSKILGID